MAGGDATIPGPDSWGMPMDIATRPAAAPSGWSESDDKTIAANAPEELPTLRVDAGDIQTVPDTIENPAHFVVRTPESSTSQEYLLDKKAMTIGRVPESDICFPEDKLVSRTHATVRYENGGYIVRDEGSANGTFLNSQELPKMTDQGLRDGDIILIGDQELTFRAAAPVEPGIEEGETVIIAIEAPAGEATQADEDATIAGDDPLGTRTMELGGQAAASSSTTAEPPAPLEVTPVESSAEQVPEVSPPSLQPPMPQTGVTVNSFTSLARQRQEEARRREQEEAEQQRREETRERKQEEDYYEQALQAYDRAPHLDPLARRGKGNALAALGRYDEALQSLYLSAVLDPRPATYARMGDVYLALRRYSDAVTAYKQAIALEPQFAPAYASLGDALEQLGRTQDAEQAREQAKQLEHL
jgi:pSer/pThr/pTyr-binding forkhead associated (FHA) protein